MIRAVVFDLDGTLVDSLADIAEAVNSTLIRHGREPHPVEAYKAMVGWGLRKTLETASSGSLSQAEFENAFTDVMEVYRARPVVHTRAYAGIGGLLRCLDGRASVGVLSNKEDAMTRTIVSALFPNQFHEVRGAVPGKPHKPDPAALVEILAQWGVPPDQCAYLGDSGVDMETARRAGVLACGALWGFRERDELLDSGAHELFASPSDFLAWLLPRLAEPGQNETTNRN